MLLGIGLLKRGSSRRVGPARNYWILAMLGFGIGLPLAHSVGSERSCQRLRSGDHSAQHRRGWRWRVYRTALGHVAVVMLVWKAGALGLAHVAPGRRWPDGLQLLHHAEPHLHDQLFYGYGFGLFGQLQRYQLYYVSPRCMGRAVDRRARLAPPFPVRTTRVAVAFADLRRDPADAPPPSRGGRTAAHGLIGHKTGDTP